MDCKELDNPPLLIQVFREKDKREIDRIFSCFETHYYSQFMYSIYNNLARRHSFLKGDTDFYGTQAFNDAMLKFQETIYEKGFTEGTAKIKTYFFKFCLYRLKYIITEYIRAHAHLPIVSTEPGEFDRPVIEEDDLYSEREIVLKKALSLLEERSRQFIILRKLDGLNNEQIAEKMGIQPGSVNNEVYKAVKKLKAIIETLKAKK